MSVALTYLAFIRLPTEKAHGLQIVKTCEAYARAGAQVSLVTPDRKTTIKRNPFDYYGIETIFSFKKLHTPDLLWLGGFGFVLSQIIFGICTLVVTFKQNTLFISQDEWVLFVYALFNKKYIYEVHSGRDNIASRLVSKNAQLLIANSRGTKEFYKKHGVSDGCIEVAPNGVDVQRFAVPDTVDEARKRCGLPALKYIVLYTGHLYDWKGVETLAQSAQLFPDDVLFVFVGGTKNDVTAFKQKYILQKNILVLGHRAPEEIPYFLRSADSVVLPNDAVGESEQFTSPMKLFEYMASKKPIVASDLPPIREIVGEKEVFFFTPGDYRSLATTVQYVLSHTSEAQEKSKKAFQKTTMYTWNREKLLLRFKEFFV